jgi:RecB family endonuclease NucS
MLYLMDDEDQGNVVEKTFAELGMKESDVEDLLRKHIELVCDDDENMLVIGEQVVNEEKARSDLTALDGDGNIVLIEMPMLDLR